MPIYALNGQAPELPADGDFWIAPNAVVIGNVRIARGVNIWFGAVLRGDTEPIEVGAGSNIQENSVLHTDPGFPLVVGADCTIGHGAILHGCTIEDAVLVGMGATVLNGARLGSESLVGANALVTEGRQFAARSLVVGAPAKAVRSLDDEAVARIHVSAETYRGRMRAYRAGLVEIG